jgi:copper(I)-binding protein
MQRSLEHGIEVRPILRNFPAQPQSNGDRPSEEQRIMRRSRLVALVIALTLTTPLAVARGMGAHPPSGTIGMTIKVSDAWVAPSDDGSNSARLYMNVVTHVDAKLVYAFAREAKKVEPRETLLIDGELKDRRASWIKTSADKPLQFAPGGNYLLITGLAHPLAKGDSVTISMVFNGGDGQWQKVDVTAEVRDASNAALSSGT